LVSGWAVALYTLPLALWLVGLCLALLVFFPRTYQANISSWRESKTAFDSLVAYKHAMLKAAGLFLALGGLALFVVMAAYLVE